MTVWSEVAKISRQCYEKEEIGVDDCRGLFAEVDKYEHGFHYVADELLAIIHTHDRQVNCRFHPTLTLNKYSL